MGEMTALAKFRAELPEPSEDQLLAAEQRFVAAIRVERASIRTWALPRIRPLVWRTGLVTGLAALVAAGVLAGGLVNGLTGGWTEDGQAKTTGVPMGSPAGRTGPALRLVSTTQVLDLAAQTAETSAELNPRPDQFIVYQSITTYPMYWGKTRYLYRTKRKIWLSVDGRHAGALRVEYQQPQAYPGWPIPAAARRQVGDVNEMQICPSSMGDQLSDWAYRSTLPTDPERMLESVRSRTTGGKADANYLLWAAATDMFRESYLPAAQRAALFRAIKLIPGVVFVPEAKDAADRTGVAVGYLDNQTGIRSELVFDPATMRLLGEREFVVDAALAGAPIGSQLASTAELSVSLADKAPAPFFPKDC